MSGEVLARREEQRISEIMPEEVFSISETRMIYASALTNVPMLALVKVVGISKRRVSGLRYSYVGGSFCFLVEGKENLQHTWSRELVSGTEYIHIIKPSQVKSSQVKSS